ncbi:MAG: hypothetical protein JO105_14935 [Hyphomicrobiales bacterium]|nr:hypothetical protein [Hyphomicrobiales bacterium]
MPWLCVRGRALALALALSCAGHSLAAATPVSVAREAAKDRSVQTHLPDAPSIDRVQPSDFRLRLPDGIADIVLWGAIAAGIGLIVWAARESLPGFRGSRRDEVLNEAQSRLSPVSIERLEEAGLDADALARDGRIVEAMHLLLLRSFGELKRTLDLRFADSLTSREILSRLSIPDAVRGSLAEIVHRVELAYFGNRLAEVQDYVACRKRFEELTRAVKGTTGG